MTQSMPVTHPCLGSHQDGVGPGAALARAGPGAGRRQRHLRGEGRDAADPGWRFHGGLRCSDRLVRLDLQHRRVGLGADLCDEGLVDRHRVRRAGAARAPVLPPISSIGRSSS